MLNEIQSVGITCNRITNGAPIVREEDQGLADLVVAAHEKQDGDSEITDLKAHLGADSDEWAAYVEARKAPIREERQARYKDGTDPMRFSMDEDHTPGSDDWNVALGEWRAAKQAIKAELPYPVTG
jgi:hypothetical protein